MWQKAQPENHPNDGMRPDKMVTKAVHNRQVQNHLKGTFNDKRNEFANKAYNIFPLSFCIIYVFFFHLI